MTEITTLLFVCILSCVVNGHVQSTVEVSVDSNKQLFIGNSLRFNRNQYLNVHSAPIGSDWRPQDISKFAGDYDANLGRSFLATGVMSNVQPNSTHPGYVNLTSLVNYCDQHTHSLGGWPFSHVDMIVSAKAQGYYPPASFRQKPNQLAELTGMSRNTPADEKKPSYWPKDHAAAADYWVKFLKHCPIPNEPHYFCEVANECNVHARELNTTFEEMIKLHIAIGDAVHHAYPNKKYLIAGPTAAYPEWESRNFTYWNEIMGAFIDQAAPHMDLLSVHIYSTMEGTQPSAGVSTRTGNNAEAILDLHECAMLKKLGKLLPHLLSEYGGGFKVQPLKYEPYHDWFVMYQVNAKLFQWLDRPDRIAKAIPFIVAKATWYKEPVSESYPFALWRHIDSDWKFTYLHLFYDLWREVTGDRVSSLPSVNSTIQVQVRAYANYSTATTYICLNNIDTENVHKVVITDTSLLQQKGVIIKRLFWDKHNGIPTFEHHPVSITPNTKVLEHTLEPSETAILSIQTHTAPTANTHVYRTTYHNPTIIQPITPAKFQAYPFKVNNSTATIQQVTIRVSFAGPLHSLDFQPVVTLNDLAVTVTAEYPGGKHTDTHTNEFFGCKIIPVDSSVFPRNTSDWTVAVKFRQGTFGFISSVVLEVSVEVQT